VIVCAGQMPDAGLATALRVAGLPHVVIGGAAEAGDLDAERAFRDGARAPAAVAGLIGSRP
jgi:2,4-dienoyl-CoA reductase (NADPH2)